MASDKDPRPDPRNVPRRPPPDVTEAELSVLVQLWERGAATIRQLSDALYPRRGASGYATVQKLLERLAGKGCVARRKVGRVNVFRAAVGRSELVARRLEEAAEALCDGAWSPLLTTLVRSDRLSDEELAELRRLLDDPHPGEDRR